MCNIYRGIQNTTYYVQHLSWNTKHKLLCVGHLLWNTKYNTIMCNIYRGIQNATYYV